MSRNTRPSAAYPRHHPDGELHAAEIAARCGFCNASHFTRAVKAAFGYPPGVFRLPAN